jgi:hypothetical protein
MPVQSSGSCMGLKMSNDLMHEPPSRAALRSAGRVIGPLLLLSLLTPIAAPLVGAVAPVLEWSFRVVAVAGMVALSLVLVFAGGLALSPKFGWHRYRQLSFHLYMLNLSYWGIALSLLWSAIVFGCFFFGLLFQLI